MTSMSFGSMPAWAIASQDAFTTSDSLVSPSSLPNLPWDQPTMQAVMELSSIGRAYTLKAPADTGKPDQRENSSLQPYFRPAGGVDWGPQPEPNFEPWPIRRPRHRLPSATARAGPGSWAVCWADSCWS